MKHDKDHASCFLLPVSLLMSYQVLARKYRPQRFEDIIGQDHITRTLQNAISEGRVHHAYLFTGIRGIGKTTLARIFSKMLNCKEPSKEGSPEPCNKCPSCVEITNGSSIDVQEIDGASNNGVENVRDIRERVKFLPATGKYKIYIIDEVHMLSGPAFNALLKTLEEPPAHVIFIFATTESHKIPATILSRCQRHDFRRIPLLKIVETLKGIAKEEKVEAENDCLEIIATEAEGSMRDAESLFDQAIAFAGKKLAYDHLKELLGFLDRKQLNAVTMSIISRDADGALAVANELFASGENLNRFVQELLERFHDLLVIKTCKELPLGSKILDSDLLKELAPKITVEECQQWFNMIYRGSEDVARTKFPKMVMDVLIVGLCQIRPVRSVDELIEKVEQLKSGAVPQSAKVQTSPTTDSRPPVTDNRSPVTDHRTATVVPQDYPSFIAWLKLNKPQVASFLEISLGGDVKESRLMVRFASRSFASDKLMEEDRKAFVEKLAGDFFKRPLKLEVAFEAGSEASAQEAKKNKHAEISQKNRGIKDEALKHDVIREAANIFGAEIKEIKIK